MPHTHEQYGTPGIADGLQALDSALVEFKGRIAAVSSFGTESAVLLALVADRDRTTPMLFIDTGKHFPETLAYRDQLVECLGLQNVRDIGPSLASVTARDPQGELHRFDADACCSLRKVEPLEHALQPFAAWVTGRKRSQSATRAAMPVREKVASRTKINPLSEWTAEHVEAEMVRRKLPRHPLAAHGFKSIGCSPCTRPTLPGADPRSGRWATIGKTECGIHRPSRLDAAIERAP